MISALTSNNAVAPPAPPSGRIAFGIAGWSYADWDGIAYPRGTRDKLAFIAAFVDLIEINTTFYRPPDARLTEAWLRRVETKPDFFFTAKLHQDITHGGRIEPEMARAFQSGLRPLAQAGRLRHLLAQFKFDFDDRPERREHLRRIRETFGGLAHVTLELRHNSWQSPAAFAFLETLDVTVANLDYPLARNSFNLRECRIGTHRYLRLHGRNTAAWFDRRAGRDEVYNYNYPEEELNEIARRAAALAVAAESLTVVANNHFQAREVTNILQLKRIMTGQQVPVPECLLAHYPELKPIALPPA